jgi:hypothetical protein
MKELNLKRLGEKHAARSAIIFKEFDAGGKNLQVHNKWGSVLQGGAEYEGKLILRREIPRRLEDGTMPCDEPWPKEQVSLFKRWMDEGMAP